MQAILGILILIGFSWLLRERPGIVSWRIVAVGLLVQFVLATLFLKVSWVSEALLLANHGVLAIETATSAGTSFLFGYLGGGAVPFDIQNPQVMYLFAFRVLPQVIVFSVLVAILWYWRVLPAVVRGLGAMLRKAMQVSGVVGTAGAASLFLGMVETPLVVRAYLKRVDRSDFFTIMTLGMSTVAGSVMVLYAGVLRDVLPGAIGLILAASVLNVIGALYVSRLFVPKVVSQEAAGNALSLDSAGGDEAGMKYSSFMDAITKGTADGLTLAMNVGAMLLVLISLVALVNGVLGAVIWEGADLSLQRLLGWLFAPIAWLIGIPWADAEIAGGLLGTKFVLNELVAYIALAQQAQQLSGQSQFILTFALCGFANLGSLGILLGGLSTLVPSRRDEFLKMAPKSLISGTVVTLITAAIVSVVSSVGF